MTLRGARRSGGRLLIESVGDHPLNGFRLVVRFAHRGCPVLLEVHRSEDHAVVHLAVSHSDLPVASQAVDDRDPDAPDLGDCVAGECFQYHEDRATARDRVAVRDDSLTDRAAGRHVRMAIGLKTCQRCLVRLWNGPWNRLTWNPDAAGLDSLSGHSAVRENCSNRDCATTVAPLADDLSPGDRMTDVVRTIDRVADLGASTEGHRSRIDAVKTMVFASPVLNVGHVVVVDRPCRGDHDESTGHDLCRHFVTCDHPLLSCPSSLADSVRDQHRTLAVVGAHHVSSVAVRLDLVLMVDRPGDAVRPGLFPQAANHPGDGFPVPGVKQDECRLHQVGHFVERRTFAFLPLTTPHLCWRPFVRTFAKDRAVLKVHCGEVRTEPLRQSIQAGWRPLPQLLPAISKF